MSCSCPCSVAASIRTSPYGSLDQRWQRLEVPSQHIITSRLLPTLLADLLMNRPGDHCHRLWRSEGDRRPPEDPALHLSFLRVHPSRVGPDGASITPGSPLPGLVHLLSLPLEEPVRHVEEDRRGSHPSKERRCPPMEAHHCVLFTEVGRVIHTISNNVVLRPAATHSEDGWMPAVL